MSVTIGKVVVMGFFRKIFRGLKKRKTTAGIALTAQLEARLRVEFESRSRELVSRLEGLLVGMALKGEIPTEAVSTLSDKLRFEINNEAPQWADAAVDYLRRKLRLPDDD